MDSGAAFSLITLRLAKALRLEIKYKYTKLQNADGRLFEAIGLSLFNVKIGDRLISHNFQVAEKLSYPCIIGNDIMKPHGITINLEEENFIFNKNPNKRYILGNAAKEVIFLLKPCPTEYANVDPESEDGRLNAVIAKFPTVCRNDGVLGQTDILTHKIELTENKSYKEKPRFFPPDEAAEIDRQCADLLEKGLIRYSTSPFGFNIVLSKKSDGTMRMTVNYKKLNQITRPIAAPMHNADVIMKLLPSGKYYSKIDLKGAFWQIRMDEGSVEKTAFYGNGILYEWLVLPFGLTGSPATFALLMNRVLQFYIAKFCFVFVDDILVYSKTFDEHLEHLTLVFERLKDAKLTVNLQKCSFAKKEVEYLGHIITQDGIRANPSKVSAILHMPSPQNKGDINKLNGLCSYLLNFMPNFAEHFAPISSLLKKTTPFFWGPEQNKAFKILKKILMNDAMLEGINYDYPLYIRTDASDKGMSGILCQKIDGIERVISYDSKKFKDSELHLSAVEKECKAVLRSLRKFSGYLGGEKFIVYTDNKALTYLKSFHTNKNLTRWSHEIEQYNCEIKHFEGKKNILADILSRFPDERDDGEPDQLTEGPDCMYTPIFSLTFYGNLVKKLKEEQSKDEEVQKIIKDLSRSPAHKDFQASNRFFKVKNGILHRYVLPFSVNNLVKDDNNDNYRLSNDMVSQDGYNSDRKDNQNEHISGKALDLSSRGARVHPPENAGIYKNEDNFSSCEKCNLLNENASCTCGRNIVFELIPYLPSSMKQEVLTYFHSSPEFPHFGCRKTKQVIKSRFFWNGMNKEINSFVKGCKNCQKFKHENLKIKGLMGKVPYTDQVMNTLYMDFIGPFPPSKQRRNRFCLVVVDQLSGWVELAAMPNAKAFRVTSFLEDQICCRYGSPKVIVTDNASNFIGKTMKKLCRDWAIKHVMVSAYHASANRCERNNKDIGRMIASFAHENHQLWDVHLQKFALALRSMINETTGVSPDMLNLGRKINYPIDNALNEESTDIEDVNCKEMSDNLSKSLSKLIVYVRKQMDHAHEVRKILFDKTRRDVEFNIGDMVMVRNHQNSDATQNISKKLLEKWIGPFKILDRHDLTYKLDMTGRHNPKRHVSDLKPYFPPVIFDNDTTKEFQDELVNIRKLRARKAINYREVAGYKRKK